MVKLELVHKFNPELKRHYFNNYQTVLHCHHYSTLYTQSAFYFNEVGFEGIDIFIKTAEEVFGKFLKDYYQKHQIQNKEDRISIAEQYWKTVGMGIVEILSYEENGGKAVMEYSHIDEGWLKKWGGADKPVNLFTRGFLAGTFAAVFNKEFGSYKVEEVKSIVMGDDISEFQISLC